MKKEALGFSFFGTTSLVSTKGDEVGSSSQVSCLFSFFEQERVMVLLSTCTRNGLKERARENSRAFTDTSLICINMIISLEPSFRLMLSWILCERGLLFLV